jgi:hypothetical protein
MKKNCNYPLFLRKSRDASFREKGREFGQCFSNPLYGLSFEAHPTACLIRGMTILLKKFIIIMKMKKARMK